MEEVAIIANPQEKGYDFAKGIYDYISKKSERNFSVGMGNINRIEFKDKEYKIKIEKNIRRKKCIFIHDSNTEPARWFTDLAFTLEAIKYSSPFEITAVLPYTRFARQERKDESRVSVNAKAVANIISTYADRGITCDLHAPQMQEYFSIPFDNLYTFPVLINHLKKNHKESLENLVVVSPDTGGAKRVEAFQKKLAKEGIKTDLAIGYKKREKENEVGKIDIMGEVNNMNCLIIDDLIDTGGTLVKTAEVLRKKGARKVMAYGTHGLFSSGTEHLTGFDCLMTSNTLQAPDNKDIQIVSLTKLFGEAIYRTIVGKSLSNLFEEYKED